MEKSRDLKQNRQHSAQAGRPHRHLLPSSERQDMRTRRQEEGLRSAMRGQGLDPELGRERSRVHEGCAARERGGGRGWSDEPGPVTNAIGREGFVNVLKGEPGSSGPASLCCSQGRRQPARQHTPPRGSRTPAPAWHGGALLSPPQALLILPGPLKPISPGASAVSSVQRPVSSLLPRPTPARPPRLMYGCVDTT